MRNLAFSNNSASVGGLYTGGGNPALTNVTFSGNSAFTGDGMYVEGGKPTLSIVTFSGNAARYEGGGFCNIMGGSPTLTPVTFIGNAASSYGGAVFNSGKSLLLTNVTFRRNSAG